MENIENSRILWKDFFQLLFLAENYILRDLLKEDWEATICGHLPFPYAETFTDPLDHLPAT